MNSGDKAKVIESKSGVNLQTEGIHTLEDLTNIGIGKKSVAEKSIKYNSSGQTQQSPPEINLVI